MVKKVSLGEIRTMADDLLDAEKKQPSVKVDKKSPTPPAPTKPQPSANKAQAPDAPTPSMPAPPKPEPKKPSTPAPSTQNQKPSSQPTPPPMPEPAAKPQPPKADVKKLLPFDEEEDTAPKESPVKKYPAPESKPPAPPASLPKNNLSTPKPETPQPMSTPKTPSQEEKLRNEIFPSLKDKEEKNTMSASPLDRFSPAQQGTGEKQKTSTENKKPPQPPTVPPTRKRSPLDAFKNNNILKFGLIGLFAAILIGGSVWFLLSGDPETETPIVDETPDNGTENPIEEIQPDPLVTPDFIQEIVISDTTKKTLSDTLELLPKQDQKPSAGSITYIPIQLGGVTTEDNRAYYLDGEEFLTGLGIEVPEGFFNTLDNAFMLYMYQPTEEERVMCQNNLVTEDDCFGPRLGMVFKAIEANSGETLSQLADSWVNQNEKTALKPLTLNQIVSIPEDLEFSEEEYSSAQIHYVNLPIPSYKNLALSTTSLDIAVLGDYMVFATSKNSTTSMIDRLFQELF